MAKKLTDIEAYDRLHAAALALGSEGALTPAADTALRTARLAIVSFQMALIRAMDAPPQPMPPPPY